MWNYENALICKEVFLKKVIAETSKKMMFFYSPLKWHHGVNVLLCDYPI